MVPSQRGSKSLSRTFSFPIPSWWNELPTPIRNAESLTIFKRVAENSSLSSSLEFCFFLFIKKHLCSLSLTSPGQASFCSKQCLKCCITRTSCDCLPLYNALLIVFLNCKSLWIKVSAKWINVKNSYRLETTCGWVNDDNIFILGWTRPISLTHNFIWNIPVSSRWSRASSNIRRCMFVMGLKDPHASNTTLVFSCDDINHIKYAVCRNKDI